MKLLLFCYVILFAFSCDKSTKRITNGTYIGTFERNGTQVPIQLTFTNGQFSGVSDSTNFPAICSGTYSVSGNTISFENGCGFLANFDHTLILWENWNYSWEDDVLTLTKTNGDVYNLIRQ